MPISLLSHRISEDIDRPSVTLTDRERTEVRALAEELHRSPAAGQVDDPRWLTQARRQSCRLPVRLLEALRDFRSAPGPGGYLLVGNLPVDAETLPDTPSVPDSVERRATVAASTAMLLGQQLGDVFAFRNEKHGALVHNVVPVPALAASQSNGGSVELELHNENAFHPYRPDLIGLLCLRSDHEGTAGTLFSSIRRARVLLRDSDVAILRRPRFVTEAPPSFGAGDAPTAHCVLNGSFDDPDIQVDFNATRALDAEAGAALRRLGAALAAVASELVLRPGDMAFLDNRLVVHGRTEFLPRYDGNDRWLHRVYVHLDGRPSLSHRIGPGPVLA
ncbi:TauD/TfdA family dioxygenase [Streptomyces sp. NPDC102282]|uniref:TauD/TfdA family dioxygenase n=1 Tax=Streptomyces sp. NPDC102282 TaxID=3366154 RepID=UPI003828E4D5